MNKALKICLTCYRLILLIALPLIIIILLIRLYRGKEHRQRILERFGYQSPKFSNVRNNFKKTIWINAVSVGEANTALTLAQELIKFNHQIQVVITTTTTTSAKIISDKIQNYNQQIIHQFLPIDLSFSINKFLNFWQPIAIIFVESELWPNIILTGYSRKIKVFFVNARISNKSLRIWQKITKLGINIFDYFSIIIAQSSEEQAKIQNLTKHQVLFLGNLKSQSKDYNLDFHKLDQLKAQIDNRPIWLCASTHDKEEKIIFDIHRQLLNDFSNLLTIVVLRHPNRLNQVINDAGDLIYAIRSKQQSILPSTSLYLVDTLNELSIFYYLADFAFIAGSLFAIGGHNPFEAIKQNCAVISGEGVANFAEIYQELVDNKSAIIVKNKTELYLTVKDFLSGKKIAQDYAKKASKILVQNQGVSERIVLKIAEIIPLNNK
ncbi:MAG: 3-deoxy-D-manno-octulosonic acid transferase [Alphaproteobacteria bacterium]